jgi:NTE family protein
MTIAVVISVGHRISVSPVAAATLCRSPAVAALGKVADHKVYNIVHLIYRSIIYEGDSQDYEFSAISIRDHWTAGHRDTIATLNHPEVLERPKKSEGIG